MPEWQPAMVVSLAVLIVVNMPVYWFLRRLFFEDWAEFAQAFVFWVTPDAWSFLKGEFWEDFLAEAKLAAYLISCSLIVGVEFLLVSPLLAKFIE